MFSMAASEFFYQLNLLSTTVVKFLKSMSQENMRNHFITLSY